MDKKVNKNINLKEDPLTAYQLRMLEPIYRLIFTADEKLRKFYNELKQSIE